MNRREQSNIEHENLGYTGLLVTLNYLREHWFDDNTGIVGATLFAYGRRYSATSRYLTVEKKWLHAEAATIEKFESQHHRPPDSSRSRMVVTLSPCLGEITSRNGDSCSHRLSRLGIYDVWYGCLDTNQTPDPSEFTRLGIRARIVENPHLQRTCENLYALFAEVYNPNGKFYRLLQQYPNPWPEVKKIIGLEPFNELDNI